MKVVELSQREVGAHVTIENKETFRIARPDLVTKVIKPAGRSQLHKLLQIADVHAILALHLIQKVFQLGMLIGADDKHFLEVRHLTASVDVMFNDGHASDGEERLGDIQR